MSETFVFTLHFAIAGATDPDEFSVRVYNDDRLQDMALMGPDDYGSFEAEFEREAHSLPVAVLSAVHDLTAVLPQAEVMRVQDESLVSLGAIARRLGRSHESVRLYARNKRGPGNFPAPIAKIDDKTEVWNWNDVAAWWEATHGEPVQGRREAAFLSLLNNVFDMHRAARQIPDDRHEEMDAIAELLPGPVKEAVLAHAA
jgi:hypothetical protein